MWRHKIRLVWLITLLSLLYPHQQVSCLLRSFVTIDHVRFYVAPIPPKYNKDLLYKLSPSNTHEHVYLNSPFGRPVSCSGLCWNTIQFSSSFWFHQQLLQSPHRVMDVNQADFVYVPVFFQFSRNVIAGAEDILAEFSKNISQYLPYLGKKPHVVFNGKIEEWAQHHGNNNLTTMTIEMYEAKVNSMTVQQLFSSNTVVVPYPNHLHPYGNGDEAGIPMSDDALLQKKITAVASFATRTRLREALSAHCLARANKCAMMLNTTTWQAAEKNIADGLEKLVQAHRHSWFCLQPRGDTYTRRSLFQCMGDDAIPVVFSPAWIKAFPFADVVNVSSFIVDLSAHGFSEATLTCETNQTNNVIDYLDQLSDKTKRAYYHALVKHQKLYTYTMDPAHELLNFTSIMRVDRRDDAFTMSIKALMRNLCRRKLISSQRCGQV